MRRVLMAAGCLLAVGLCGCSREEQPHRPTAAETDAQIQKVQNDPKMPAGIKQMVLGKLQAQKAEAQRQASAK